LIERSTLRKKPERSGWRLWLDGMLMYYIHYGSIHEEVTDGNLDAEA
jgi:hypothetical protein